MFFEIRGQTDRHRGHADHRSTHPSTQKQLDPFIRLRMSIRRACVANIKTSKEKADQSHESARRCANWSKL